MPHALEGLGVGRAERFDAGCSGSRLAIHRSQHREMTGSVRFRTIVPLHAKLHFHNEFAMGRQALDGFLKCPTCGTVRLVIPRDTQTTPQSSNVRTATGRSGPGRRSGMNSSPGLAMVCLRSRMASSSDDTLNSRTVFSCPSEPHALTCILGSDGFPCPPSTMPSRLETGPMGQFLLVRPALARRRARR